MKNIKLLYGSLAVVLILALGACSSDEGFISDNITYSQNPFNVTQGRVVISNSIVDDGSTLPLRVKLLSVRNKATGEEANELMQDYETTVYRSQISKFDTTFELVQAKLEKKMWPVFNVNEVGGQLQFSPETVNVPPGEYTFDVEISNDSGKKIIKDICTIRVFEGNPVPAVGGQLLAYKQILNDDEEEIIVTDYPPYSIQTTYEDSEENIINFRFVDKDGDMIDPVKFGFREFIREQGTDYKFSDAAPWLKGSPKTVSNDGIAYSFPVGPFPYNWIENGKTFRFSYIPTSGLTEFEEKTGYLGLDFKIYTDGFKVYKDGRYTVTVTCESIDL
jgi:hypothetical protein